MNCSLGSSKKVVVLLLFFLADFLSGQVSTLNPKRPSFPEKKKKFPSKEQQRALELFSYIRHINPINPLTMAHCERVSKPLLQCLRQSYKNGLPAAQVQSFRSFGSTAVARDEAAQEVKQEPFYKAPDPELVTSPRLERKLVRSGVAPVGSRRRRAALKDSANLPFEQLPYQCFQEARKFLLADRQEKLQQIETERARIARLRETDASAAGGEVQKQRRLKSMENHLEELKIHADINDPVVKKKFEDGIGMSSTANALQLLRLSY